MLTCLFITGTTGSGKTTLLRRLGAMGWATFSSGELFRHMKKQVTAEDGGALAPLDFDRHVWDGIQRTFTEAKERLNRTGAPQFVAIECVPRVHRQWEWVSAARSQGWSVSVWLLDAAFETRRSRITGRDATRAAGDKVKVLEEKNMVVDLLYTKPPEISARIVYTDGLLSGHRYEHDHSNLGNLMSAAENYFNAKKGYHWAELSSSRMIERCIGELTEAMPATDTKHRLEELVDALWFLLLAFRAEGADGTQAAELFMQKYGLNNQRMDMDHGKPHLHSL